MNELLSRRVLPEWPDAPAERWEHIADAPPEELWRVRTIGRERLVGFVRARLRASAATRGETDTAWIDHAFDPAALTIGWARRFATYKRANLLLAQPDRLRRLLRDTERPVQLVFAGKAHPADDRGKEMIRAIVQASRDIELRTRMVFLEDYDMALARVLYQGVDLWLNTPRRPQEACGTSGMKAALNGAINCSVLDGWFDELYNGDNGWAIKSAESHDDTARRDEVEGSALFDLLENEIVPAFYDRRSHGGAPGRWIERMTASLASLGPAVSASRMVRDYVNEIYEPLATRATTLSAGGYAGARALAAWKERTVAAWPEVRVTGVETDDSPTELGAARKVLATVSLGALGPDDVAVQLLHGPVGPDGELERATVVAMQPAGDGEFWGELTCDAAGRYGFTVRVVPAHPDLETFADVGVVTWVDSPA